MRAQLLNRIMMVLAFAGIFVAGVLSAGHLLNVDVPCGASNDCATVAAHPASSVLGVPIAYFGLLAYLVLAAITLLRAFKGVTSPLVLAGFVIAAFGTVISGYLQYQSFFVIQASCRWCIASAAIMVALLILHAFLANAADTRHEPAEPARADSMLAIGLPVALILALGISVTSMTSGKSEPVTLAGNKALPANLKSMLTEGGHSMGAGPDAKVTIVEFADLQCGACQTKSPELKLFAEKFPDKVRLIYRHFPLSRHDFASAAAAMSEYAAEKDRFWEFIMGVMALQREVESADELFSIAKDVGLDVDEMRTRVTDPNDPVYARVAKDMDLTDKLGINITPTFFIFAEDQPADLADSSNVFDILQGDKYKKLLNGP